MAGERKGKAFEALIVVVARNCLAPRGESIHWNLAIPGQSVVPDVWVASSDGVPKILLLVTHSAAPSASEKKFWRNVGEIAEAKVLLAEPPLVVSILFDNAIKASLGVLESRLFDVYVDVPKLSARHAAVLSGLADTISSGRKEPQQFPEEIVAAVRTNRSAREAIRWLTTLVESSIRGGSRSLHAQLWEAVATRQARRTQTQVPAARNTFVRRGIAKLLVSERPELLLEAKGSRGVPHYLISLALVKKTINGIVILDEDIKRAIELLGRDRARALLASYKNNAGLQAVIRPLRFAAASAEGMQHYVVKNWGTLHGDRGHGLVRHLMVTHREGAERIGLANNIYVRPGWLFLLLTSLLKAHRKRRQGFGYAKLIKGLGELSRSELAEMRRHASIAGLAKPHALRAPRTIEYGLRDWFYGEHRQNFTLTEFELFACARVLAIEIAQIDAASVPALVVEASKFELADQIENILIPYNAFQPLKDIILIALSSAGVSARVVQYFPNPLREMLADEGTRMNVRAGSTEVILAKRTLIRWISSHEGHVNDKRKEFGGRGALLPITWSAREKRFIERNEIRKLVLMVDGMFADSDLAVLHRLGWDEIFYPDEIDRLMEAIV
jgi:hypothetical protein